MTFDHKKYVLSKKEMDARKPLAPHIVMSALQGSVHVNTGKCRIAKSVKVRKK